MSDRVCEVLRARAEGKSEGCRSGTRSTRQWRRSQGSAGAFTPRRYSHDHERLYAGDDRAEAAGPHQDRAPSA